MAGAERAISNILTKDVAPVAEKILREHIQRDIYDAYTPVSGGRFAGRVFDGPYARRHVLERNVVSELTRPYELFITSTASPNRPLLKGFRVYGGKNGGFLELLETGDMGIWRRGFPRPAVSLTQEELDRSPRIEKAIVAGLKREIGRVSIV